MTTKTVYTGTNDDISITLGEDVWNEVEQKNDFVPISFIDNNTSKIEISFADQNINSVDNNEMILFNNDGEITLKINSLTTVVKDRTHPAIIKVFDPEHLDGQTPVAPNRPDSNLSLIFK